MKGTEATVSIHDVEYPRSAVEYGHVASLLRLATLNVVRRAEVASLSGTEDPRELLAREIATIRRIGQEHVDRLTYVLDTCYGAAGHDFPPEGGRLCRRCGASNQTFEYPHCG